MLKPGNKLAVVVAIPPTRTRTDNVVGFRGGVTISPPQTDIDRLQGRWAQTYLEANGEVRTPEDAICIFEEQKFLVMAADGTLLLKGSFLMEDRVLPKAITWADTIGPDAGKLLPSIYKLEGNTLTVVVADEGEPRPTTFATGPGITLREFTRIPRSTLRLLQ